MRRLTDVLVALVAILGILWMVRTLTEPVETEAPQEPEQSSAEPVNSDESVWPSRCIPGETREACEARYREARARAEAYARNAETPEEREARQRRTKELFAEQERRMEESRLYEQRVQEEIQRNLEEHARWRPPGGKPRLDPIGSEGGADDSRKVAREKLERLFQQMAPRARRLLAEAAKHGKACGMETQGYCGAQLKRIGESAVVIGRSLDYARELSRTSWLPPGEVRALRKRYGLEDAVWDELERTVQRFR